MSNRQIAAIIARRKAAQKNTNTGRQSLMLAACIAAAGFDEHRAY